MDRRSFLASGAGACLWAAQGRAAQPKRIGAVITEYRENSHADVIIGKYLEGYNQDGKPPGPRSKIVSMYTAQVPDNDMSRDKAKKHGVPIFRTIYEALTLGTGKLAVDGVLLIGEHGDYPLNDKGQKLYPRFELFIEIADVFRQTSQSVPVFNDKHLSYSWIKAKRMVDISEELRFPMMAGSSVPVSHRDPEIDLPRGASVKRAAAVAYGGQESYAFHMLESLQSMVERRKGGETGVASVECLDNEAVWAYVDRTPWAQRLMESAISRSKRRQPGELKDIVKQPTAYLLHYRDGLETATFMLNGAVRDFTVAVDVEGRSEPVSTLMWLEGGKPYRHFACLSKQIEKMFESGKPTYPVQRTLLVSGVLDFCMESRFQGYKKLDTPELVVKYESPRESNFCKGAPPWA